MFRKKKKSKTIVDDSLYGQLFPNRPKTKDGIPKAVALKDLFEEKVCGEVINDVIYVAYEMNANSGLAILGATANYDFSIRYLEDFDDETKFWVAVCTLKYVKAGYSTRLDEARKMAIDVFNSYPDEVLKTKISLLI